MKQSIVREKVRESMPRDDSKRMTAEDASTSMDVGSLNTMVVLLSRFERAEPTDVVKK
jgi:hypothetical protein